MPLWFHHFMNLFARVFVNTYTFLGTSPGGIIAQVVLLFLTQVRRGWRTLNYWKTEWRNGIKRAVFALAAVWAVVFMGCTVTTIYGDHISGVEANKRLMAENNSLKGKLDATKDKNAPASSALIQRNAELAAVLERKRNMLDLTDPAFSNMLQLQRAFGTYRRSIGFDAPCVIKITAPTETQEMALVVAQLANVSVTNFG